MRSWSLLCGVALAAILAVPAAADEAAGRDAGAQPAADARPLPEASEAEALPAPAEAGSPEETAAAGSPEETATAEAAPEPGEQALSGPEAAGSAEAPAAAAPSFDDFDRLDPATEAVAEQASDDATDEPAAAPAAPSPGPSIQLGPEGVDEQGRRGRIHTVRRGNTLWDISEAYLGTPWVWPSVWRENDADIANPHLIRPGDLIWITSTEMRRVTRQEADEMLAAVPEPAEEPAAPESVEAVEPEVAEVELPASLESEQVSVPLGEDEGPQAGPAVRVASRESMSFVSAEELEGAASVVGSPEERTWLGTTDRLYLGLGEGEVKPGDEFTVFRQAEPVRDVDGDLLGYHVEVLGWTEVREAHGDTSSAEVRLAIAEMRVGDRVLPREAPELEVRMRPAPVELEGNVVFMPADRTYAGSIDYVYVNRGRIHGLEQGSALVVVEPGKVVEDEARDTEVLIPDREVASLVVVEARAETSVAFVTSARDEIGIGYVVKAASPELARAR